MWGYGSEKTGQLSGKTLLVRYLHSGGGIVGYIRRTGREVRMNQVEFELEVAELLVATGLVLSYDCDRAHASLRGGPGLRQALIASGATTDAMWEAAVEVVKLVRSGKLPKDEARTALNLVGSTGMPIAEALTKMGYAAAPANPWEDKLKELTQSGKYRAV